MLMLRKKLNLLGIVLSILLVSCEEEGTPLTLNDIYKAQDGSRPLFQAHLNGRKYTSEEASVIKRNGQTILEATNSDGTIEIYLTDYVPAVYTSKVDEINQIHFIESIRIC